MGSYKELLTARLREAFASDGAETSFLKDLESVTPPTVEEIIRIADIRAAERRQRRREIESYLAIAALCAVVLWRRYCRHQS